MKSMEDYTIYCTEEQTRLAWLLGAPFKDCCGNELPGHKYICTTPLLSHTEVIEVPTTQQMIEWLRKEKSILIEIRKMDYEYDYIIEYIEYGFWENTEWHTYTRPYECAERDAIDEALNILIDESKKTKNK